MNKIKKEIVDKMNYSEFVGLIKERNRPSGGIKTIQKVAVNAFIDKNKKMLEIGSNTGFTSVNMSMLTGCKVVGIDTIDQSVNEARKYAKKHNLKNKKVKFIKANTLKLPFADNSFDIVWCSNVTSFISEKEQAIKEYLRVLKHGGSLVVIPIYYIKKPPVEMIRKVSDAIGVEINVWSKLFWKDLFDNISKKHSLPIDLYYENEFIYLDRKKFISEYVEGIINQKHLKEFSCSEKKILKDRFSYFISLFNENLKYAGYSILIYQKKLIHEEPEIFLTKKI